MFLSPTLKRWTPVIVVCKHCSDQPINPHQHQPTDRPTNRTTAYPSTTTTTTTTASQHVPRVLPLAPIYRMLNLCLQSLQSFQSLQSLQSFQSLQSLQSDVTPYPRGSGGTPESTRMSGPGSRPGNCWSNDFKIIILLHFSPLAPPPLRVTSRSARCSWHRPGVLC